MSADEKRVAIYARVSTTEQTAENQMLDLRQYCSGRGWTIVQAFIDIGESGAKEDRPALLQLMAASRKRQMDMLLVWRFDRFARSTSHLVATLQQLRERHIDFASYSENIDTATAQGKLVFTIFAAIAEFERGLTIERVLASHRRYRSNGGHIGRPFLPEDKRQAVIALRGQATIRQIAARTGVAKSVVHSILSGKSMPNVAFSIVEPQVAF